jgi:4-amino-4-deoxy-L-arabinose transferase-like glycosyltransferase
VPRRRSTGRARIARGPREPGRRWRLRSVLRDRLGIAAIAALASLLLFANLGNRYLWQDEAQTALVARTILDAGIPLGTDGRNHFSQELGAEYGKDGIWKWHTWLSFYLVAGSFAALGADTLPTRLPFALCALATVVLSWFAARDFWGDRASAFAAAQLLTLSVPFLIAGRQGRYYALASLLSLVGLHAYWRLAPGARRAPWLLFGAALLVFHTHYVYAATLLATLLIHALCFERQRLRPTLVVAAAVAALAVPWIVWFSGVRLAPEKARSFLDLGDTFAHAGRYTWLLFEQLFAYGAFLLIPAALGVRRWLRGEPGAELGAQVRSGVALLVLYCAVTIALLSLLSPLHYVRYLFPLLAPLFLLAGLFVGSLWRVWPAAAVGVVVAFAIVGSLRDFVYELTHDYDGPIEGIVEYLRRNAEPGDVVAMAYGDLPVKFYLDLRVVGGLAGEDLAPVREADWIIPRRHVLAAPSLEVAAAMRNALARGHYERHELEAVDIAFENREDPKLHHFRSVEAGPRVVIWERSGSASD